jgi:hypothetical protein
MLTRTGGLRRLIGALLALLLLALPSAPVQQASAVSGPNLVSHHCAEHLKAAGTSHRGEAVNTALRDNHGRTCCFHIDALGAVRCCGECVLMIAVAPGWPTQTYLIHTAHLTGTAIAAAPDGLAVDPALRPPRPLA